MVKNNKEALSIYKTKYFPIVFLLDSIDIAKKIREYSRETIIAIIVDKMDKRNLLKGLFIHIIGYIELPFQETKIEELLSQNMESGLLMDIVLLILEDLKMIMIFWVVHHKITMNIYFLEKMT